MTVKSDQPEQRDRALARLLAEALKPAASSEAASHAACPDAEILAAYADQGLAGDERNLLDNHFAACERCRKILAVLAASPEAPFGELLTERAAVASAPVIPAAARRPPRPSQRWFWWLAPALGAAAAVTFWIAVRPVSPGETAGTQTAADYSRPAEQKTDSLIAQSNLPPPPEVAPPAAALRRDTQSAEGNRAAPAEPAPQAKQEAARDEVTAWSVARPAETAPAAPAARSEITATGVPPLVSGTAQGVIATEQMPLGTATNSARAGATPAPALPATGERAVVLGGTLSREPETELPLNGRNVAQLNLYTFASPDGSSLWRLGAAGRIERSTDRGQTWQQQASGVTTDLLAGSAASKDVAWVVGRAGVILRTSDGEHWQRVASPNGFTGDWAAVVARDALNATVVAADLRRFSTVDGGRTWTLP